MLLEAFLTASRAFSLSGVLTGFFLTFLVIHSLASRVIGQGAEALILAIFILFSHSHSHTLTLYLPAPRAPPTTCRSPTFDELAVVPHPMVCTPKCTALPGTRGGYFSISLEKIFNFYCTIMGKGIEL